ncbi:MULTISPECIES: aldolase [Acetobacter]|jgi:ribulose-5-phosphate 4-epimerase/fuculose-1-phosphate aldolase|uniref:Ribulose-5-phosphate 4-epimerase/fuculose-1-phosphate aldolase n=1 Tax=Acetobacter lovaniensis TaxID=104100 RepID=A0A841QH23_9PROT|nr:aldolase [Acetobacter lovaniensis]MBB6457718.1 ribulose-5-phosphate 4-epimerase/fuculose-1-phosphate aldolase [Acetobacter lovaniensis]MCP1239939.1 aldolase [Acetobacter lovaniensis]NHN82040.1 aldolase [Acetobacter lovaniensis]GBQ71826.1 ribulose-5-phosphate 4-epimerase [Acetobacter lovaniensis NRIC 0474]
MAHQIASSLAPDAAFLSNSRNLDTPEIWEARKDLSACLQMAARLGLAEGICNHFSAVVPGHDDLFLVNPYGLSFAEVTPERLLICDYEEHVLAGDGVPEATAFYIHARVHKNCPRARAAFHTHMPYATALSMTEGDPLLFAGQTALKFYGRIAVDTKFNGLALDVTEGDRIAAAAGNADILFMRHHGVMVLATEIAQAWDDLYYLERAAEVQCLAMATGRRLIPVPPEVASHTARQMREEDARSARLHLASIRRQIGL